MIASSSECTARERGVFGTSICSSSCCSPSWRRYISNAACARKCASIGQGKGTGDTLKSSQRQSCSLCFIASHHSFFISSPPCSFFSRYPSSPFTLRRRSRSGRFADKLSALCECKKQNFGERLRDRGRHHLKRERFCGAIVNTCLLRAPRPTIGRAGYCSHARPALKENIDISRSGNRTARLRKRTAAGFSVCTRHSMT